MITWQHSQVKDVGQESCIIFLAIVAFTALFPESFETNKIKFISIISETVLCDSTYAIPLYTMSKSGSSSLRSLARGCSSAASVELCPMTPCRSLQLCHSQKKLMPKSASCNVCEIQILQTHLWGHLIVIQMRSLKSLQITLAISATYFSCFCFLIWLM